MEDLGPHVGRRKLMFRFLMCKCVDLFFSMKTQNLIITLLLFCSAISFAQQKKIDSVLHHLKTEKRDTAIISNYLFLADAYFYRNNDSAMHFVMKAKALAEKIKDKKLLGAVYNELGGQKYGLGQYAEALKYQLTSLELNKEAGNKVGLAKNYNMIGTIYWAQGDYPRAMKNYLSSLKICEEDKNEFGIADANFGIGLIADEQKDFSKALKYYNAALLVYERTGNKDFVALVNNNIGGIYYAQENYPNALKSFQKALDLLLELGKLKGVANGYNNIAIIYEEEGKYDEAIKNYNEALKIKTEIGDKKGVINTSVNLAGLFIKLRRPAEAKKHVESAMAMSKEIGSLDDMKSSYYASVNLDTALGNYKAAYHHHVMYIQLRDSLYSEENTKKTIESQMQYEFDKKQVADSLRADEERKINAIKFEKEKQERYYLYGGLILVLVFTGFVFNRFKVSQKQKRIIEMKEIETNAQKLLLEEKQKEIIDSINYAKRIQQSQLPTERYISRNLDRLKKN